MRKFKWAKFGTYLTIGLVLLCSWGYVNYTNYEVSQYQVEQEITANVEMIDDEINNINMEQMQLRNIQRVVNEAPVALVTIPAPPVSNYGLDGSLTNVVPPTPAPPLTMTVTPTPDPYQARIDELEAEKAEYKAEKGRIATEIANVMSLFQTDVKNPFINIVFLPLVAYFLKKLMDFGFRRLEEKFHHET